LTNDISTSICVNLGVAIATAVFVAEALHDLEVPIEARDHDSCL